jgi:hypothetical protein
LKSSKDPSTSWAPKCGRGRGDELGKNYKEALQKAIRSLEIAGTAWALPGILTAGPWMS